MSKVRNNLFYLMDKKELYTSYGDFKGWGSAYTEFGNIFSTAKGTQKD